MGGRFLAGVSRFVRGYLLVAGAAFTLASAWLLSPLPLLIDEPLVVNEVPENSSAIVCLGGGTIQGYPGAAGWHRIALSVRLYRAGLAPVVIFSGGAGYPGRPEAEIYADAARSMGLPGEAIRLEARSASTVEHPRRLNESGVLRDLGGTSAPLLVVSSPYHGRRVRAVFQHAGYTRVRVVTAMGRPPAWLEDEISRTTGQRIWERIYRFLYSLREWTALGYYKLRGWI
jgi:uncharacterized SAM-binding protein YcdF (DUF218 family)